MEDFSTPPHAAGMKSTLNKLIERKSEPAQVGPRVTAIREALELPKAQFADMISLDRSSLTKIEAGKAGLDIQVGERISALYGVGLDFIYRGDLADLPDNLRQKVIASLSTR